MTLAGFDIDRFPIPPPDDLTCAICHGVINDPTQTPCSHLFCRHCITTWLDSQNRDNNQSKACPVCDRTLTTNQFIKPPFAMTNMIKAFKIKCSFAASGCGSLGNALSVETVDKHEQECEYGPAQCTHKGCPNTQQGSLKRMEVEAHKVQCEWRLVECPNKCGIDFMLAKDLQQHIDDSVAGCIHKVVLCSAGCGQNMRRGDMTQHQHSDCSKTLIGCCVEGCDFQAERGKTDVWHNHNQTSAIAHLGLTMSVIKQLSTTVRAQQQTSEQQQQQIQRLSTTFNAHHQTIQQQQSEIKQLSSTTQDQQQTIQQQQGEIKRLSNTTKAQQQQQQVDFNQQQNEIKKLSAPQKELVSWWLIALGLFFVVVGLFARLSSTVQAQQSEMVQLLAQVQTHEQQQFELKQLSTTVEGQQQTIKQQNAEIKQLSIEVQAQQSEIKQLSTTVEGQQQTIKQQNAEIKQLSIDVQAQQSEIKRLSTAKFDKYNSATPTPTPTDISVVSVVTCEGETQTLSCSSGVILVKSAVYGRSDHITCVSSAMWNTNCAASTSLTEVATACNGLTSCSVSASNDVFGNPCFGTNKFLATSYKCVESSLFTTKYACELKSLELSCPSGKKLNILTAAYGRSDHSTCWILFGVSNTNCFSSDSFSIVYSACNGRSACSVPANNHVFGDPCGETWKYLSVKYACL